tara:strand:+ start:244 stop:906 length:663 start_codon:yes stop_codon:yes gene_type:complete
MEEIVLNYNPLYSLGFVSCNVPTDIMNITKKEIDLILALKFKDQLPYNNNLAGSIEHEYILPNVAPALNRFFDKIIPDYWRLQNNLEEAEKKYNIIIQTRQNKTNPDIWVNFQKKHEFNPLHDHYGSLSFVYWVKIPYKNEEESKLPHFKGNTLKNPVFTFVYSIPDNIKLQKYSINVDNTFEGQMIIFPSWLEHMVTPFYTSDDYRISISGNLSSTPHA